MTPEPRRGLDVLRKVAVQMRSGCSGGKDGSRRCRNGAMLMCASGSMYYDGRGVDKDYIEARKVRTLTLSRPWLQRSRCLV